eukprot:3221768-Rhodomonas_salina.2
MLKPQPHLRSRSRDPVSTQAEACREETQRQNGYRWRSETHLPGAPPVMSVRASFMCPPSRDS